MVSFGFVGKLFSVTKALSNGAQLSNEGESVVVSKGPARFVFNIQLKRGNGHLLGCKIRPSFRNKEESYLSTAKQQNKIDINVFHKMLGHPSDARTISTAKDLVIELTGELESYNNCAFGKMQQMKVPKERNVSSNPGDKIFLDISTIKYPSEGGKRHWALFVDDCTKYKWSIF